MLCLAIGIINVDLLILKLQDTKILANPMIFAHGFSSKKSPIATKSLTLSILMHGQKHEVSLNFSIRKVFLEGLPRKLSRQVEKTPYFGVFLAISAIIVF